MSQDYIVTDISLADWGRKELSIAETEMPGLMALRDEFGAQKPLQGARVAGCLHMTVQTAVLIETLVALGADVRWSSCNIYSTQDQAAAAIAASGVPVFAKKGETLAEYWEYVDRTFNWADGGSANMILDDGGDLTAYVHEKHPELLAEIKGVTEETTTGVHRLRAMGKAGDLKYPVIAVNDAITKWDFDNVYGTGQSTIDGIVRATSVLIAGKTFVVAGYGHCGKGVAMRAQGMGANVIITEVDPLPALRAVMDGFRVMTMDEAAKLGDIFCTATGMKDVIVDRHFASMKDGAIISNTGHYDCEINIEELTSQASSKRTIRDNNVEYTMKDGRQIFLLADGRLVNLAAAEGHPSEVMDMSFANQYLALCRLAKEGSEMKPIVYDITTEQDQGLATTKLATLGFEIDSLTDEQIAYLDDYNAGT